MNIRTPPISAASRRTVPAVEATRDGAEEPRGTPARIARGAALAFVAAGILARLWQYGSGRALWLDESFLWINLDRLPARAMAGPLELAQGAPIPFLLAEKAVIAALGDGAWALRLLPLLFGVAALILAYVLARRLLRPERVWLAVAPLALGEAPIYYSAELKQYSLDMLVAVALVLVLLEAAGRPATWRVAGVLGAAGAVSVWLSDPAVFTLAGGGAALLADAAVRRDARRLVALAAAVAAWLASFAAVYLVHVRDLAAVRGLATNGTGAGSADSLVHTIRRLPGALVFSLGGAGGPISLAALVLAVLGAAALWRSGRRVEAGVLALPAAVLALAALAGQYPVGGRFTMFLGPSVAVLSAAGAWAVWDAAVARGRIATAAGIVLGVVCAAFFARHLTEMPYTREELDQVIMGVHERARPGDAVYLYYASQYAFAYYGPREGIPFRPIPVAGPDPGVRPGDSWAQYSPVLGSGPGRIVGRRSTAPEAMAADVERVRRYRRVWLVFSHVRTTADGRDESKLILRRAETFARPVEWVRADGAFAVLMERR